MLRVAGDRFPPGSSVIITYPPPRNSLANLQSLLSCTGLARMAFPTECLPVPLIPEEPLIPMMRDDMIDLCRWCHDPLLIATTHHGAQAIGPHATQRMLHLEARGCMFPPPGVATFAGRATRTLALLRMRGAVPVAHDHRATRIQAEVHRFTSLACAVRLAHAWAGGRADVQSRCCARSFCVSCHV